MVANTSWRRSATAAGLALAGLWGCAAEPESDAAGTCSLNCSSIRVASSNYTVSRATNIDLAIQCGADPQGRAFYPLNGPIKVRFKVVRTVERFGPWDSRGGGSGLNLIQEGGGSGSNIDPIVSEIPVGGIGFEPLLYGNMSIENTNDEFKSDASTASSFQFAGVVTPTSEWCSDTCGNMSYEFWPLCVTSGNNPVTAGIMVQGAKVDTEAVYDVSISGASP